MSAYSILDVSWHDETKASEYRKLLGPSVEKYGGRTLVANAPVALDGGWDAHRIAIMEFPTMDALQKWYHSAEHAPALRLRTEGATSRMIAVERPPTP